jgi:hypothetical protein
MILNDFIQSFGTNANNQSFDFPLGWFTVILPQFTMRLKRSGFSLVLSLTIMAAMVMMVIVLASFLQVESRLAQSHAGYLRARFNALASARIAIGQLQQLAGPDQRVTMRADMYADNDVPVGNNDGDTTGPVRGRTDRANNNAPTNKKLSHQKRYLTGVWATGGVDPTRVRDWDVTNPADSRLFLGWLASPFDVNASPELSGTPTNYIPNSSYFDNVNDSNGVPRRAVVAARLAEAQAYIDDLGNPISLVPSEIVPLVSYGSVNLPAGLSGLQRNYMGAVDARPQPLPGPAFSDTKSLGANGRYAFWIGDEGVKAKVNLPDYYAATSGGSWLSTEDWDKGFAGSANQRNSIGVIGGSGDAIKEGVNSKGILPIGYTFDTWRAKDITDAAGNPQAHQLSKAVGISGLSAWAAKQGGVAAGQAMNDAAKILWHDITTYSYSTLTDTYSGGVKIDLSTAFELPYSMYRGIELYPGQKDSTITGAINLRKQSLFHGSPNAAVTTPGLGANGMAVDLDYNRPNLVDKLGSDNQLLLASPRASEWAPRYLKSLLGNSFNSLVTRNGNETPERLGFVYEAPLRSAFFDSYSHPVTGVTVSRLIANTENSPNATATTWSVTSASNNLTQRINVRPWPELLDNNAENLIGRIVRGPTWDLYRNYYRMYKREVEQAGQSSGALRGQPAAPADAVVARGVEPLTYASGNRNEPMQRGRSASGSGWANWDKASRPEDFYAGGGAVPANRYYYRNNFSAPSDAPSFQAEQRLRYPNILAHNYNSAQGHASTLGNIITNFDRMGIAIPRPATGDGYFNTPPETTTRTWPTSMSLTPSIVRFSMVFSGVFADASGADPNGTLGVTIDPVVMVHNPYDVAIEFEGISMVTNGDSLPYIFDVKLSSWGVRDVSRQYYDPRTGLEPVLKTDPLYAGTIRQMDLTIGEVALGDGTYENRTFSFRLVKPGSKFRLEPGEVKTLSAKNLSTGGTYKSARSNNTVITTTDFGYDLGSSAVYKMTPFYNVRYRSGTDVSTQFGDWPIPSAYNARTNPDARMWTWGFMPNRRVDNKPYAPPAPTGLGMVPEQGFYGNYCTSVAGSDIAGTTNYHSALDLWNDVVNSRNIKFGMPSWDGTAKKLKQQMATPPPGSGPNPELTFSARNSGWVNYDNRVVGEEGDAFFPATFVFPRKRNGTTAVSSHQRWNFYLIGNKSIDGLSLNPDRRWFGSKETLPPSFNPTTGVVTGFEYEGSGTAPGQHLVDESLILNFQALTAGWPLYGNDNGHWSSIIQFNEEWRKSMPGGSARTPDYRIATGQNPASHTNVNWRGDANVNGQQVSYGPQNGDPEFGRPEITAGRAGSLNGRIVGLVRKDLGDTKQPFFLSDFVLRSAEMTAEAQTKNIWYPATETASAFKFQTIANNQVNSRLTTPAEIYAAPMSPYFLSVRPQQAHLFGYDGKAHTPIGWVLSQRRLDAEPQIALSGNNENAYWGDSVSPSTTQRSDTVLFPIPRRPLLSIAQLGSAGTAQVNTDADFTVGSSFAHPGIMDLTKITDWPGPKAEIGDDKAIPENGYVGIHEGTRIIRNFAHVRTDHAFAANLALWDAYYFSGLNLQATSYSLPGEKNMFPAGPDLPTGTDVATDQKNALKKAAGNSSTFDETSFQSIKEALEAGYNPLANKRVVFQPDTKAAVANGAFPAANEFPHPTYLARNSLYDGGFNVNSTSKNAWKAVLAGMRGQTLPDGSSVSGTVLTKFARSFKSTTGVSNAWNNYRELTDAEIDVLAAQVVKEVRDRGPFMSLGDFINRRLLDSKDLSLRQHGLKGALQAAIDKSGINKNAITEAGGGLSDGTFAAPADTTNLIFNDPNGNAGGRQGGPNSNFTDKNDDGPGTYGVLKKATNPLAPRFPNIASMSEKNDKDKVTAGLGAPKVITQLDVLNTVGPNLTARSDTFTVRAYGEALDNAGNTIGRAWVEVVVQRTAQFMLPSARGPAYEEMNRRKSAYRVNGNFTKEYDLIPMVDPYESNFVSSGNYRLPTGATAFEKENWNINRLLGRRFKASSIRWLNANEI